MVKTPAEANWTPSGDSDPAMRAVQVLFEKAWDVVELGKSHSHLLNTPVDDYSGEVSELGKTTLVGVPGSSFCWAYPKLTPEQMFNFFGGYVYWNEGNKLNPKLFVPIPSGGNEGIEFDGPFSSATSMAQRDHQPVTVPELFLNKLMAYAWVPPTKPSLPHGGFEYQIEGVTGFVIYGVKTPDGGPELERIGSELQSAMIESLNNLFIRWKLSVWMRR